MQTAEHLRATEYLYIKTYLCSRGKKKNCDRFLKIFLFHYLQYSFLKNERASFSNYTSGALKTKLYVFLLCAILR